ncbi:ArsR/SmtB family transcription factor [Nonomuraea turcica]|uniref:ArsR/SmtB family transcription factor n=1 Tax=Nonomuraea sp. G32 TaxID=3067274 RepID=UPI00273C5AC7|nr:metalloregulator ArsR/SmtB family transcription factor [Nonomuraea sp. G32]MDP4500968.1 metalloregulator ArsR/SmtB family transcription factor [Nonomuraea sp. G32]
MELLETLECCSPLAGEPLDTGQALRLARVFKALGDPVRLRIVSIVASHAGGEACVCDLTASFDVSQPTISHHLKVLKQVGLLTSERRASWVYYRIVPEMMAELSDLLDLSGALGGSREGGVSRQGGGR